MEGLSFAQAIQIHARSLGLHRLNDAVVVIVRCCNALPLLPRTWLEAGVLCLWERAIHFGVTAQLDEWFSYIENTWTSGRFADSVSVFGAIHRTNNISESVNRMLRLRTKAHHPNIPLFMGMCNP